MPVQPQYSALHIRSAQQDDYPQWKILWDDYNAFYGRSGATALPLQITHATWSRIHDASEPVHALVAESEGKLLGLAHYLYHRNTILIGPTCYLQDLFTTEAARGRGVARALIEQLYRRAADEGAERVYWHTHHSNATARRLYDTLAIDSGFIVYRKNL
ncbi:GNAT family N-acetyltransferase [Herbaspirillum rubrisubalbicans]|jgi:GNAT superfamily N-acetyltransferase|uniref:N-acetyltransferase n=1 Tax=Herbaspirillum rubrisubalbicans Os34 TaxID=1235827 RepID=A0A6M3ZQR2_9BURK|nr:GNAT family N-acetyltransferase [Herbaspirillum rubrisubalbicans]QJQ00350.1 N-acetyltransferase [Herbaspirillum rubrisubalbicans Os34]